MNVVPQFEHLKLYDKYPFTSIMVSVFRLIKIYLNRLLNPEFAIKSRKDQIEFLTAKTLMPVVNERSIESYK